MKKSQILAALALAFALGVVTPVAGLVENASAVDVTSPVDTATTAQLKEAVAKAENNAMYKAYTTLNGASGLSEIDEAALLTDVNDAIEGLNSEYTGDEQKETLAPKL